MTVLLAWALVAGAASVLTPCVLPLLPTILAFSTGDGRRRVIGLVVGLELSFVGLVLLLGAALNALGLPDRTFELLAAALLVCFGLVLVVPRFERAFERGTSGLVSRLPQRSGGGDDGFWGGIAAGATLGLVWTPCAGPILASVTVASHTGSLSGQTVATAVAYGIGMAGPLLAVLAGGRRAGVLLRQRLGGGRRVVVPMGVLIVLTGVLIGTGQLTRINAHLASAVGLSSTPTASLERSALTSHAVAANAGGSGAGRPSEAVLAASGYPASDDGQLHQLGPAPDFAGIRRWYNTGGGKALRMGDLRGKVVLVDFWTYSCINCLRTLPHIRDWYSTYRDKGLVVVGVHTPEFEFEKDPGNVGKAIHDLHLSYPVALDADYGTWQRFHNQYWPAKYLIDRNGTIRFVHYGEGGYGETEQRIRDLLGLGTSSQVASATQRELELADANVGTALTPETYVGADRASTPERDGAAARYAGDPFAPDVVTGYRLPARLAPDAFALGGSWKVMGERALAAGADAQIALHYQARDVFLVIGPDHAGMTGVATVTDGGRTHDLPLSRYRLYTLRHGAWASQTLHVHLPRGFAAYAFTFG